MTDEGVLAGCPLLLILAHKLLAAEKISEELRHIMVLAVALQRIATHDRLGEVGKEVMACRHLSPVEVIAGIEVPERSHDPLAVTVLMHEDGTGSR